jgi:hypothetical protein
MVDFAFPTPPATQALAIQAMDIHDYVPNGVVRHERFYCLDHRLLDPVILQVCPEWPAGPFTVLNLSLG